MILRVELMASNTGEWARPPPSFFYIGDSKSTPARAYIALRFNTPRSEGRAIWIMI